jgi:hypothetical protein
LFHTNAFQSHSINSNNNHYISITPSTISHKFSTFSYKSPFKTISIHTINISSSLLFYYPNLPPSTFTLTPSLQPSLLSLSSQFKIFLSLLSTIPDEFLTLSHEFPFNTTFNHNINTCSTFSFYYLNLPQFQITLTPSSSPPHLSISSFFITSSFHSFISTPVHKPYTFSLWILKSSPQNSLFSIRTFSVLLYTLFYFLFFTLHVAFTKLCAHFPLIKSKMFHNINKPQKPTVFHTLSHSSIPSIPSPRIDNTHHTPKFFIPTTIPTLSSLT